MEPNNNKCVIIIKYLNPYDLSNPLIWKHKVYGPLGSAFNSQQYINYAKAVGYSYDNVISNASVFKKQPQTVAIQISKTPIPNLTSYTKIIYKDLNDKQALYSKILKGQTGKVIDFDKLTNHKTLSKLLKNPYQFVKLGSHDKTIKNGGKNIIWVKKVQPKIQKRGRITLYYLNPNNQLVCKPRIVTGLVGSKFNVNLYQLPKKNKGKYQFKGLIDGKPSYKFTNKPQGILIRIKPILKPNVIKSKGSNSNKLNDQEVPATISIYFKDRGKTVAVGSIQRPYGKAFHLTESLAKKIGMPNQYRIVRIYPKVTKFTHGIQKIFVNLTKISNSDRQDNKQNKKDVDSLSKDHEDKSNLVDHKSHSSKQVLTNQTPQYLGKILIKLATSLMMLGKILKNQQNNN